METVYSYTRLLAASILIFWGLYIIMRAVEQSEVQAAVVGIGLSAVGLTVGLVETAFVFARFVRARAEDLK